MNRLLGICVSILKGLTFMPSGSPRKKRKKYLRKNVQFSKFGTQKNKLTEQRNQIHLKQNKCKKTGHTDTLKSNY